MKRSAERIALSGLWMLVAACDRSPTARDGSPGIGLSMTTEVRRASSKACGEPDKAPLIHDAQGVAWWSRRDLWCRTATHDRPAQAWTSAPGGPATHRIIVAGQQIALLEREVPLVPISAAPVPPPFAACGGDVRSRVFAAQNRIHRAGDVACGRAFRGPDFTLTTVGFQGASGTMPTLVTAPHGAAKGTILYVPGGPYENLPAGLVNRATINHLLARWGGRASLVMPAYLGVDRVRFGKGDVTRARAEVEALVAALKRRGPVCVIGFSMGAAIAAPAVARQPDVHFLLTAPLATQPVRFVERARQQGRVPRPITVVPAKAQDDGKRHPLTLSSDQAFLDYFAGHETRDLAALLGPDRHPNVRIAYARGDIPVLRQDLTAVAPMLPAGAMVELPAAIGHTIEAPYAASAYRPYIDAFLEQCTAAKGGASVWRQRSRQSISRPTMQASRSAGD